jgi:sulfur-carrier protein adenylyltransferase/sulfurtransferase
MKEIGVKELKKKIDSGEDLFILDVREEMELDFGKIEGSKWIPIGEVEERISEIPKDKKIVAYCRSGGRSQHVLSLLEGKGYKDVCNLTGGILDWGLHVDDSIQPY